MRRVAILAFVVANLLGCASTRGLGVPSGSSVAESTPASLHRAQTLAADTIKQLVALYPPASTRFDLGQPTRDAYGTVLVESLRTNGYALFEFKPAPAAKAANPDATLSAASGLNLRYQLDAPANTNLIRITVMVGSKSLSRAYVSQNDTIAPVGAWSRKE